MDQLSGVLVAGGIVLVIAFGLRWVIGRGSGLRQMGTLQGPGSFSIEVVGESHYQDTIERICGGCTRDGVEHYCQAVLVLEDANLNDRNAVRVDIQGTTVGYLPRHLAREYRKRLAEAGYPRLTGACRAVIRGGWDRGRNDRGYFGVRLDLPVG